MSAGTGTNTGGYAAYVPVSSATRHGGISPDGAIAGSPSGTSLGSPSGASAGARAIASPSLAATAALAEWPSLCAAASATTASGVAPRESS